MSHIFVSHATADNEIVTRIHNALEDAGIDTWVDHEDGLNPGDNWSAEIHTALNECTAGLFVLSPASAKSTECEAEYRRIMGLKKRLYVALIHPMPEADFPWRLTTIQYVDLTNDFNAGIATLVAAITGKPSAAPDAPKPLQRGRFTGELDPMLRAVPISGRDDDLGQIRAKMAEAPTLITGVGGLGKSRLAAEIALKDTFPGGVVWHRCSPFTTAEDVSALLRTHYKLEPTADATQALEAVAESPALVVLDNAEDVPAEDVRHTAYVKLAGELFMRGARVIITSRVEWNDLRPRRKHEPAQLPLDDATQVARDMSTALDVPEATPQAEAIARAARQHPRLIEQAILAIAPLGVPAVLRQLNTVVQAFENTSGGWLDEALKEMVLKTVEQMKATAPNGEDAGTALRRLTVFRGGFTRDAAQFILGQGAAGDQGGERKEGAAGGQGGERKEGAYTDAPLHHLDSLLTTLTTWRFVTRNLERYHIDPLVIAAVGEDESAHRSHYDYYKALAWQHNKKQDYLGLDPESDNLEAAFEWAMRAGNYEDAYWLGGNAASDFLANRGRFEQRRDWLERVAMALESHPNDELRAAVQNSLGILYQEQPTGSKRENLRRAVEAYTAALAYYTPSAAPLDYAMTQNNLGNAYADLAQIEDRAGNLRRAVEAYTAALEYYTPSAAPLDYAMTQNNLGIAYHNLSEIEDRAGNLRRAVEAYTAALEYQTPSTAPLAYAMTQNNLGIAYWELSKIEDRAGNLRRAVEAYTAALEYRTPSAAPLDYAMTQNNLGIAYADLAQIEDRAGNLRRAVEAYTAALEYLTPSAAPLAYAMTQNNLGNAYRNLSEIEDRAGNLRRAVEAYTAALVYRTPSAAPLSYAMTQNNLGIAYRNLSEIEDRAGNLRRAVDAYTAALEYYTPSAAPLDYATTQRNMGDAQRELGDLAAAIACWREAERYYRQMDAVGDADLMLAWIAEAEGQLGGEDNH